MPRPTVGSTNGGFTLVEVLVSLAALAIGFVILWGMHFAALRVQSSDKMRTNALNLATGVLENEATNSTSTTGSNSTFSCDSKFGWAQQFDNCTVRVSWFDWEKRVAVRVSWLERISLTGGGGSSNKRTQSVQLNTIYIVH